MIYHTATLEGTPFRDIHGCFAQAFADYAVPSAVMDEPALRRRARKNDWSPELSAGVWAGDELVAISLTGVDNVNSEKRGYDICTAVVPGHRGRGVAGLLMDEIAGRLRRERVRTFQLEVLQGNQAGIHAYEKAGFRITRGLVSYAAAARSVAAAASRFQIHHIGFPDLLGLSPQLDFEPSYEQRDSALAHIEKDLILLGAIADGTCVAAIAFDPETSWIMRLLSHRRFRRRGCASALLAELARNLPPDSLVKAVNIDVGDEATLGAMQAGAFRESVRQWEMRLEL